MAATSDDDEMDSLLLDFDHLHKEYNHGVLQIQSLKAKYTAEEKQREALEGTCTTLKKDKEHLMKLHTEMLNKFVEQLEYRPKYQSMLVQLNKMKEQILIKEKEHETALENHKERHDMEIGELQKQISYCQTQLSVKDAVIAQLQMELADCEARTDALIDKLGLVERNAEAKYQHDIEDLRDKLQLELEAKNKLQGTLKNAQHESLVNKMKYEEQLRDSSSTRHIDMFKQKLMKLRKENEDLKRQLLPLRQ
jgi:chromosome segregation ATPase